MPNYVTHKITFSAEHAERVFEAVKGDGRAFDFERLVPSPPHLYRGNLSADDSKDFKCNWHDWCPENWGTKWNAMRAKCEVNGDKAIITFDTAWSVCYPIIAAFINRFGIGFELRYFDEGSNFWGIEEYGCGAHDKMVRRMTKRYKRPEDERALEIELTGRDPDAPDDDEDSASPAAGKEAT